MTNYLKNLRRRHPDLQYIGVSELHKDYYNVTTRELVYFNNKKLNSKIYESIVDKNNKTQEEIDIINNVLDGKYKRRYHFHFLVNNFPQSELTESKFKNGKTRKTKSGLIIYNVKKYDLGFTTCTEIKSVQGSQHYITKYISKPKLFMNL